MRVQPVIQSLPARVWLGFAAASLIFVWHQRWPDMPLGNWIDCAMLPLILLPLWQLEKRRLPGMAQYRPSAMELAAIWLGLSLISEVLFPIVSARFTADPLDALALGLGVLAFGL